MAEAPTPSQFNGTPGQDNQLQAANGRESPRQELGYILAPSGRNVPGALSSLLAPSMRGSNTTSKALGDTSAFVSGDTTFPRLALPSPNNPVAVPVRTLRSSRGSARRGLWEDRADTVLFQGIDGHV